MGYKKVKFKGEEYAIKKTWLFGLITLGYLDRSHSILWTKREDILDRCLLTRRGADSYFDELTYKEEIIK